MVCGGGGGGTSARVCKVLCKRQTQILQSLQNRRKGKEAARGLQQHHLPRHLATLAQCSLQPGVCTLLAPFTHPVPQHSARSKPPRMSSYAIIEAAQRPLLQQFSNFRILDTDNQNSLPLMGARPLQTHTKAITRTQARTDAHIKMRTQTMNTRSLEVSAVLFTKSCPSCTAIDACQVVPFMHCNRCVPKYCQDRITEKSRQTCDHLSPMKGRSSARSWGFRSATTAKVMIGATPSSRHSDTSVPCPSLLDRCQKACRSPTFIAPCCARLSNDT